MTGPQAMRDYNTIPFRSPRKENNGTRSDQSSVETEEEKNGASLKATTTLSPARGGSGASSVVNSSIVSGGGGSASSSSPISMPPSSSMRPESLSPHSVASGGGHHSPQQQQQQQQHQSRNNNPGITAADALAIRRDGAEVTISRMRVALDESNQRNSTHKASLAKSDAVILELRSSVRQLKRQLDKVHEEKQAIEDERMQVLAKLQELGAGDRLNHFDATRSEAQDERLGELQVQLDRAHAQIITADMVRKELEDTLEAEQYTWELRVQDQERSIEQLQRECSALAEDLEHCRSQWKEAEDGWTKEIDELRGRLDKAQQEAQHWKSMQQDSQDVSELKERLLELEQERGELQGCLDEALKELEAVDAELQAENEMGQLQEENDRLQQLVHDGDTELAEQLKHLFRWLLERDGMEDSVHISPRSARELLAAIRSHLESMPSNDRDLNETRKQVADLESQLSVYRGDLQAREESSAELRASLKEAVALLKPLQDAVAKSDKEKARLQEKINDLQGAKGSEQNNHRQELKKLKGELAAKETEVENLKEQMESLELQVSRAKLQAATTIVQKNMGQEDDYSASGSLSRAREELKSKRATEKTLKQLLRDAQTRFHTLHTQNVEVEAMNSQLHDRLKEAEQKLELNPSHESTDEMEKVQKELQQRKARIGELEGEVKTLRDQLSVKEVELADTKQALDDKEKTPNDTGEDRAQLRQLQARVHELESKLAAKTEELATKRGTEKALNRSLKEALGLVKPLQKHLEDAEKEKRDLAEEVKTLRRRLNDESHISTRSRSSPVEAGTIKELEDTVKQLEKENSQLHDALEDLSHSFNASHISSNTNISHNKMEGRLREEIVELKSRNEVTQSRLENAYVENHGLVETLSKREKQEREMMDEIQGLRDKLKVSEGELENAKYIATSALVKVEELTMANVEQLSLNSSTFDRDAMYKEKARQFERELAASREEAPKIKVPYRLT